jgi:hypothetical protein
MLTVRLARFRPNQIVMVPSPQFPSWKAPDVLWYPARFIERHEDRAGKKDEYEFRRLEWFVLGASETVMSDSSSGAA